MVLHLQAYEILEETVIVVQEQSPVAGRGPEKRQEVVWNGEEGLIGCQRMMRLIAGDYLIQKCFVARKLPLQPDSQMALVA